MPSRMLPEAEFVLQAPMICSTEMSPLAMLIVQLPLTTSAITSPLAAPATSLATSPVTRTSAEESFVLTLVPFGTEMLIVALVSMKRAEPFV